MQLPAGLFEALAAVVLAAHLLWILWILLGWLATRGRRVRAALHIASLIWGAIAELGPWPCPLTLAEQWLEARSGRPAYQEGFLVHYLDRIVYPDLPERIVGGVGAGVCAVILGVYLGRLWKHLNQRAGK